MDTQDIDDFDFAYCWNQSERTTKYTTKNMGEIKVVHSGLGLMVSIYGKYNSKNIAIAGMAFINFQENYNYIMKLIDQYSGIHKITKRAIIENFEHNETVKHYFLNSLEENKVLKMFDIKTFNEFDITKAVEKLEYPRLYFEGFGDAISSFSVQYWVSEKYYDKVLNIFMDENLRIRYFMME
jgi:hypothetical protein